MGFFKVVHSGMCNVKKFSLLSNPLNTPHPKQYLVKLAQYSFEAFTVNRFFLEKARDPEVWKLMVQRKNRYHTHVSFGDSPEGLPKLKSRWYSLLRFIAAKDTEQKQVEKTYNPGIRRGLAQGSKNLLVRGHTGMSALSLAVNCGDAWGMSLLREAKMHPKVQGFYRGLVT